MRTSISFGPVVLAAVAAACAALPAAAQIGNPAGVAAATQAAPGKPAPGEVNAQDRLFVQLVGGGGKSEVALAQLALQRGGSDAVKAFARRMVQDHNDANQRLAQIAADSGVPVPADNPDSDARATQARLSQLSGAAFDRAYLEAQLVDHQKTVTLLEWEMGNGQEPRLQRHAAATLPTVLDHLRHVQRLIAETGIAGVQGLAQADWRGPEPQVFKPEPQPHGGERAPR